MNFDQEYSYGDSSAVLFKVFFVTLFAVLVFLIFFFFLKSFIPVYFNPEQDSINSFLLDVKLNPSLFSIVVREAATPHEIQQASRFSAKYRISSDSYKESEISNFNNKIFIGYNFFGKNIPYSDLAKDKEAIVVYDSEKNSLFVYAKDYNSLQTLINILVSPEKYNLNYDAIEVSGGQINKLVLH